MCKPTEYETTINAYLVVNQQVEQVVTLPANLQTSLDICGLQFSMLIFQYYGLVLGFLDLGLQCSSKMAGLPQIPNNLLQYHNSATVTCHPIHLYSHYVDRLYVLFCFTTDEVHDLIQWYLSATLILPTTTSSDATTSIAGLEIATWDLSSMMWISFWNTKQSLVPRSLTMIKWEDTFVSVYSKDILTQLLFSMSGFEVCILPKIRMLGGEQFSLEDAVWNLTNKQTDSPGIPVCFWWW